MGLISDLGGQQVPQEVDLMNPLNKTFQKIQLEKKIKFGHFTEIQQRKSSEILIQKTCSLQIALCGAFSIFLFELLWLPPMFSFSPPKILQNPTKAKQLDFTTNGPFVTCFKLLPAFGRGIYILPIFKISVTDSLFSTRYTNFCTSDWAQNCSALKMTLKSGAPFRQDQYPSNDSAMTQE